MILIYTFVLFLIESVKFVIQRRAVSLGRRYSKLAQRTQALVRELTVKPGNSGRGDVCVSAKNQLELALLVAKRDRVETRHDAWQTWADRLGYWASRLRGWKGKKLPYTLGVVDVWLLLTVVDHLGVAEFVSARTLVALAAGWLAWE